jgi:hypothetical protein
MRHPGRKFPGILVQGGNLNLMCMVADSVCAKLEATVEPATYRELDRLCKALNGYRDHYRDTLLEHGIGLPYPDPDPTA